MSKTTTQPSMMSGLRSRLAHRLAPPALALGLTFGAAAAHAGSGVGQHAGGHGPHGAGAGHVHEFMAERLKKALDAVNATADQKAKIKSTWDGVWPQLHTLHKEHTKLHGQLVEALDAPNLDGSKVEQLRSQSVQLMDRHSSLFTQGMLTTAQVLSPDQRKRLASVLEYHGTGHGPHGEH